MSDGYIGKISAVVTANTSDLERKLTQGRDAVDKFANGLGTSMRSAALGAQVSLQKIFTPLQQLERKLQMAQKLNLKFEIPGIKDLDSSKLRGLVSIAEQINKPLEGVAKQFANLSLEVAGSFKPALDLAQGAAVNLMATMEQSGRVSINTFQQVQAIVNRTAESMARLTEASKMAATGPTGKELQFASPRVYEFLKQSAADRQRATGLPASALEDGKVAAQLQQVAQLEQLVIQRSAELDAIKISPKVDTAQIEAAAKRLEAAQETASRARDQLNETVSARSQPAPPSGSQPTGTYGPSFQPFITGLGRDIEATRAQIKSLDEPLRAQLGPEIDRITIRFQNMARAGLRVNVEEARRLAQEVSAINAALANRKDIGQAFLGNFGGRGQAGLALGVDTKSLNAVGGQIEFVQQKLSRLGAEAQQRVIPALEQFREAAERIFKSGALSTEAGRKELDAYKNKVIETLSAAGGGSKKSLSFGMTRAGDIGRGGADRWSLALQQAGFAIDDFMSSTGGVDQKIRAISNNISQMAFILGSTNGLFIALGITMAAQVTLGLMKWVNGGKTAEDMAKTLNESLAKQKTLVDELASSFTSLAQSMSGKGFSAAAKDGVTFRDSLEEIVKKQRAVREEQAMFANPSANAKNNEINRLERELKGATDIGQAAAIRQQIATLEAELRQMREGVLDQPPPTLEEVSRNAGRIRGSLTGGAIDALGRYGLPLAGAAAAGGVVIYTGGLAAPALMPAIASGAVIGGAPGVMSAAIGGGAYQQEKTRAAESYRNINPNDTAALLVAVEAEMRRLAPFGANAAGLGDVFAQTGTQKFDARARTAELEPMKQALVNLRLGEERRALQSVFETDNKIGTALEEAEKEAAAALKDGAKGAVEFYIAVQEAATKLRGEQKAYSEAFKMPEDNAEQKQKKIAAISASRQRLDQLAATVPKIQEQQNAVQTSRMVNQQATIQFRVDRIKTNLSGMNIDGGSLGAQVRAIDLRRQQLSTALADAQKSGNLAQMQSVQKAMAAFDASVQSFDAATSAVKMFASAVLKAGDQALQDAQSRRDAALTANLKLNTPETRQELRTAEQNARDMEAAVAKRDAAIQKYINDNQGNPDIQRLSDINRQISEGNKLPEAELARLREQQATLQKVVDLGPTANPSVVALQQRADAAAAASKASDEFVSLAGSLGIEVKDFSDAIVSIEKLSGESSANAGNARKLFEDVQSSMQALTGSKDIDWNAVEVANEAYTKAVKDAAKANQENKKKLDEVNAKIAGGNLTQNERAGLEQQRQQLVQKLAENDAQLKKSFEAPPALAGLQESQKRGTDLVKSLTGFQAGLDLNQKLKDIANAPPLEGLTKQQNDDLRARAVEAAFREKASSVAPAILSLYDSVQNAILSGPSRAALNVSDVSTVQGARELNRLLRGEDPSKDQNLVELRAQNQKLGVLVELARRRDGVPVADK